MARPHPSLILMARQEALAPPTDIEEFLRSAAEHRMTGLVWSAVTKGDLDLGAEATRRLAADDLAVAAHHRRLWSTLDEVAERLDREGIGWVTFKGVVDEARWFDRIGERPCADIDIVIDDADRFDDAIAVLAPDHPLVGRAAGLARRGLAPAVDLYLGEIPVDLHVDPIKAGAGWRHPTAWFERTEWVTTPYGRSVRAFDREASMALRLFHLGRDKFRILLGLVEAERMMRSGADATVVLTLAALEGVSAPVRVAADIVAKELGTESMLGGGDDHRARLWRRMWQPQVRLLGEVGRTRHTRRSQWGLPLTMPGRTFETLGWMARTALPPSVLFDLKHPGHSGPYLWRLVKGRSSYLIGRRLATRRRQRMENAAG